MKSGHTGSNTPSSHLPSLERRSIEKINELKGGSRQGDEAVAFAFKARYEIVQLFQRRGNEGRYLAGIAVRNPAKSDVVRQHEIVSSHEVKSPANLSRTVVVAERRVNQHEIMARI